MKLAELPTVRSLLVLITSKLAAQMAMAVASLLVQDLALDTHVFFFTIHTVKPINSQAWNTVIIAKTQYIRGLQMLFLNSITVMEQCYVVIWDKTTIY